jgi:hypothetical protein
MERGAEVASPEAASPEVSSSDDSDAGDASWDGESCGLLTSISSSSGPFMGVLEGPGRNATVSCGVPTPGPDAFFLLTVDAYEIVELRVDAPADTFIAVLQGCGAGASVWSCATPPGGGGLGDAEGGDAGSPSDASRDAATNLRTTSLEVPLAAGLYTVIVDTISIDGDAAPFTLSASVAPPAANATCATPMAVDATMPTLHQNLTLGGPPVAVCGGATTKTLFYAIDVPSASQLTVGADATAGDHAWTPQVAAFDGCDATACLSRGSMVAGPDQLLSWINNGSASHTVILSVSSDSPVMDAEFDLRLVLTDLFSN